MTAVSRLAEILESTTGDMSRILNTETIELALGMSMKRTDEHQENGSRSPHGEGWR